MKRSTLFPRLTIISLSVILSTGIFIISTTGCAEKPGCGSKHQHKVRAKKIKRMAPSMGG